MKKQAHPEKHRYWFPAKTYGWGWGLPCTWEGWLVLLGYLTLLPVAVVLFPPDQNMPGFLASVSGLSAVLIAICRWKGEPPKWRWGGKQAPFLGIITADFSDPSLFRSVDISGSAGVSVSR